MSQADLVEPLPRDMEIDGKTFTQLYRSKSRGGGVVLLENSLPGVATGHKFHAYAVDIIDGKETLGQTLGIFWALSGAMDVAAKKE